ncbi:alpha/beta-hydrolase [Aureobasidium subglaciale]|nr:alpha/beta-hydrolase [Aureobasidium subglaciale]
MKLSLILTSAALTSAVIVQPPLGKYGVASTAMELVDTSRNDTYPPKPEHRRVMVSAYYPASSLKTCRPVKVPYMTPATAMAYDEIYAAFGIPNGTFGSFELSTCAFNRKDSRIRAANFPIVLFSPGLGNSRLGYSAMAQSLASHGYVVVTVDHAYDATIVEYPDKTVALALDLETDEQIEADLLVRQHDISFLIDQLQSQCLRQNLFNNIADLKSLEKILMLGHSLGGATAAAVMQTDPRIIAGVNLDGRFFSSVMDKGLSSPFMIMSHQAKNLTTDPTWTQAWSKFNGTKLAVTLNGTEHGTYTDMPLLANTLGLHGNASEGLAALLGTMGGFRAMELVNAFVGQFFGFVRGQEKSLVPAGLTKNFPEAMVLDKQIRKQRH